MQYFIHNIIIAECNFYDVADRKKENKVQCPLFPPLIIVEHCTLEKGENICLINR